MHCGGFRRNRPATSPRADSAASSAFTAFRNGWASKFESKKGPAEVIVVEKAEKLSEN
jgi:hypothetical protein